MVNNRRSEFDIISDIIKLSRNGAKKTEILYQGNMSYNQLQSYLVFLVDKNILEIKNEENGNGNSKIYYCTDKGYNLLNDIDRALSYFK